MNRVSRRLTGAVRGLSLLCLCLTGLGGTALAARPLAKQARLAEGGSRQGWVLAGRNHSLALRPDGTVWAWGDNTHGQLGHGAPWDSPRPVRVWKLSSIGALGVGENHSLALKADGTVWTWGQNNQGQLGDGSVTTRPVPLVVPELTNVVAIAAGFSHSLALKADGTVWAWGLNAAGQLGDGTNTRRLVPVQVQGLSGVVAIAAGNVHSLALTADGRLGNGAEAMSLVPVAWSAPTGSPVVSISAGTDHSVATRADGSVLSWGSSALGQLCQGGSAHRAPPAPIW
ncbi:hypothetical protein LXT21_02815 [Myxococcus sp. K38C18041901]|uniref:RCC1 domain-containing protein n=1 Tax=Myxococcus guangdongensis TaxID=2906760 RepID=UPI0020A7B84E|nr:hypothetical protein [Myxococcus guangdongensis]MCP3057703.1 hypothetical protein [Myxococcus guangdongensis]